MDYAALQQLFRHICDLLSTEEGGRQMGFRGAFGGDSEDGVEFFFLFQSSVMSMKFESEDGFDSPELMDLDTVLDMHDSLAAHKGGIVDLFLSH
ncbi:MAG: hypothetical protein P1V18_03245 [Candidatus Gracilibacteria bacterium]|nr:hypothetical protein [Candidatus Gracilibacteria bacterium]